MTTHDGAVTARIAAPPSAVFDLITALDRLPEWNAHIDHIVERSADPAEGVEWVVEIRAMGTHWNSRSRVQELDRDTLRFAHISQSDDGNPSFALWTWQVTPAEEGAAITVNWQLNPRTFWRRALFARIRHRQLKNEVSVSIAAAERVLAVGRARA